MTVSTSRGKALLDQHELESKELASQAMEIAARQLLHGMKKKILEIHYSIDQSQRDMDDLEISISNLKNEIEIASSAPPVPLAMPVSQGQTSNPRHISDHKRFEHNNTIKIKDRHRLELQKQLEKKHVDIKKLEKQLDKDKDAYVAKDLEYCVDWEAIGHSPFGSPESWWVENTDDTKEKPSGMEKLVDDNHCDSPSTLDPVTDTRAESEEPLQSGRELVRLRNQLAAVHRHHKSERDELEKKNASLKVLADVGVKTRIRKREMEEPGYKRRDQYMNEGHKVTHQGSILADAELLISDEDHNLSRGWFRETYGAPLELVLEGRECPQLIKMLDRNGSMVEFRARHLIDVGYEYEDAVRRVFRSSPISKSWDDPLCADKIDFRALERFLGNDKKVGEEFKTMHSEYNRALTMCKNSANLQKNAPREDSRKRKWVDDDYPRDEGYGYGDYGRYPR